jgi:hypothetical protein
MKNISLILLLFIYTFSFCQEDSIDLAQLNIKAPYNFNNDSVWVEKINSILNLKELDYIHSLDSALNLATNHRFIHSIIHSLLIMRHDSGYQVIVNHLKSKSYHRPSSPLAGNKYPIIEAILSADKSHLPFFREFLFKSNYFEKEINPEDIFFYRTLLLTGYPECDTWKVSTKPSTIFRNNLQSILDLHVIFNY